MVIVGSFYPKNINVFQFQFVEAGKFRIDTKSEYLIRKHILDISLSSYRIQKIAFGQYDCPSILLTSVLALFWFY